MPPLRIMFATPAYYPAVAFGGPIQAERELAAGLRLRGHEIEVVTTTLLDIRSGLTARSHSGAVDGVPVHYLATPLRYRWMGITPTLPVVLARLPRPDVVHVFGFRDVVSTVVAAWARARRIPYVFEPLGMFRPRVRKVRFKRLFDASVARGVAAGAEIVVAVSELERREIVAQGIPAEKVRVRPNGFPAPTEVRGDGGVRRRLGIDRASMVLYVGRIAAGKGIELLLEATRRLEDVHLVLAGPDDGHGTAAAVHRAERGGRVHALGPVPSPLGLYPEADVFVLPSEGESFGIVAAEAAAAGTPVVVTDRCGVSELLAPDGALVVPYEVDAVSRAIGRVLEDGALREALARGGRAVASRFSWAAMAERQEELYLLAIDRRG